MITWFDIVAILSTVRGPCRDNLLIVDDPVGSGRSEAPPGGGTAATPATMCSGPARGRRPCTDVGSEPTSAGMITSSHVAASMSQSSSVSVGGANTAATPVTMCSGPRRPRQISAPASAVQPQVQA
jgi:hypothetical protein